VLRGSAHRGALLLAAGAALLAVGCGSAHRPTPVGLQLQREDLGLAATALGSVEQSVEREGQASRAAWPVVFKGLPAPGEKSAGTLIHQAAILAGALPLPSPFGEEEARSLTGAASQLAGTYLTFYHLATRGWKLIDYAFSQISTGSASSASFARANVALYIESVYDAQFVLAQIGKQLVAGYKHLGGPVQFGATLTQAEVEQLAGVYSEPNFRLRPHVAARLGS